MSLKRWKRLSSEVVIDNGFWKYKMDRFELPGGKPGEYHYLHSPGSTLVIPFTSNNEVLLVKQYRFLNEKDGWEFPCGSVEENLSLEENAIKELREESGYTAGKIEKVSEFSPFTGASDEICHVFVARDLSPSPLAGDETEEFEVGVFSIPEFKNMVKSNQIWDGLTLSAFALNLHLF